MSNIQLAKQIKINYHSYGDDDFETHNIYDEQEGWKRWNEYVEMYIRDNDQKTVFFDWQNQQHTHFITRVPAGGVRVEVSVEVIEPKLDKTRNFDDIHQDSQNARQSIVKELDKLGKLVLEAQKPLRMDDESINKEYSRIKRIRKQVQSLDY